MPGYMYSLIIDKQDMILQNNEASNTLPQALTGWGMSLHIAQVHNGSQWVPPASTSSSPTGWYLLSAGY